MPPAHSLTPKLSSNHATIANASRCFSPSQAHSEAWSPSVRGPRGAQDEFTLAAIAQTYAARQTGRPTATSGRRVRCVTAAASVPLPPMERMATDDPKKSVSRLASLIADFCNKICQQRSLPPFADERYGISGPLNLPHCGLMPRSLQPCPTSPPRRRCRL